MAPRRLDSEFFENTIVKRIAKWFDDEPRWGWEHDYISETATAQGAALAYFRDLDNETLELLGVEIVEGTHPGSTYYAAELRRPVDEANTAAREAGIVIRFAGSGGV